jgi:hypothetical protein
MFFQVHVHFEQLKKKHGMPFLWPAAPMLLMMYLVVHACRRIQWQRHSIAYMCCEYNCVLLYTHCPSVKLESK